MKKIIAIVAMAVLAIGVLAGTVPHLTPKAALLQQADTGDDRYVLIEKGSYDTIILRSLDVNWKADAAAAWTVSVGAVITDSSTTGNAEIVYSIPVQAAAAGSGTIHVDIPAPGLKVDVTDGGTWTSLTSGVLDASSEWVNDSTTMECAGGDTCPVDLGDVVVIIDEVAGSATFTADIIVLYETY